MGPEPWLLLLLPSSIIATTVHDPLLSTQLLTVLFESLSGPDSDTWLMSPDPLLWAMSYAKHVRYRSLLTLPASLPLSPQQAELGPLIRGPGSSHLASPDAGMGPVPTEWPQMRSGCLSSPLGVDHWMFPQHEAQSWTSACSDHTCGEGQTTRRKKQPGFPSQTDLGPDPSPTAWELRHTRQETLI